MVDKRLTAVSVPSGRRGMRTRRPKAPRLCRTAVVSNARAAAPARALSPCPLEAGPASGQVHPLGRTAVARNAGAAAPASVGSPARRARRCGLASGRAHPLCPTAVVRKARAAAPARVRSPRRSRRSGLASRPAGHILSAGRRWPGTPGQPPRRACVRLAHSRHSGLAWRPPRRSLSAGRRWSGTPGQPPRRACARGAARPRATSAACGSVMECRMSVVVSSFGSRPRA
jgi:hypothetical protein